MPIVPTFMAYMRAMNLKSHEKKLIEIGDRIDRLTFLLTAEVRQN